jgi:hypothetical protein
MMARKPRGDAPVTLLTSSTVCASFDSVSETLLLTAAPIINGGA